MSLVVKIKPADPLHLSRFEMNLPSVGKLKLYPRRKWLVFGSITFHVPAVHEGLEDSADWNAKTWDLDEKTRFELSALLGLIAENGFSEFNFSACWAGDRPTSSVVIALKDFQEIIRRGLLGNKVIYHVKS